MDAGSGCEEGYGETASPDEWSSLMTSFGASAELTRRGRREEVKEGHFRGCGVHGPVECEKECRIACMALTLCGGNE